MRPLPPPQRRRALVASGAGHCVLFALLAVVGTRSPPSPSMESPLILAELVTALEPAAAPAATIEDLTAGPASAETVPPEPVPEPEPPPTEPLTVAPTSPPPAQPAPVEQEPEPAEPPPVERLVEVLEPPAAPATTAEDAATETPAPPDPTVAPGRALASHEQHTVRRRLSSWTGRLSPEEPDATLTWREDGQEYTAVLRKAPAAADAMGMEQLAIELTTERDGERLVTELRMNRVAFSNFAQFIDRWDPQVEIHDDLIDGRFHSNSEIRVSRDRRVRPVFTGKVTLAAGDVRTEGPGVLNRRTMFPAGIETRVRRIVLPPRAATFEPDVVPAERLRRLTRDSLITFHADGSYESRPLADGAPAERHLLGDEPFYLVGGEDVSLHVRGIVNGKVLVYSPARIVIVDDLRYADDPREPGASDYLGLVAERTVEIDEPEVTGTGDLEVHASIYARTRFLIRDYSTRAQRHVGDLRQRQLPARSAQRSRGSRRRSSSTIA